MNFKVMQNDSFFKQTPLWTARAPGRIEFIGNHTDYNGGEVLGAAIDRYVTARLAPRNDRTIRLHSSHATEIVTSSLDEIKPLAGEDSWANYPLGVLQCIIDAGAQIPSGFDMGFTSDLPTGAGLSSSAAIELATLELLNVWTSQNLDKKQKVMLAQKAENEFVGVPCGILDQAVSCFGKQNQLVHIDCASQSFDNVPMPEGCHFWIFNTNEKHSLVDSLYAERHRECREALKYCQQHQPELQNLADASEALLQKALQSQPELLKRARHVVTENRRVRETMEALKAGDLRQVGKLLLASHESSRTDFENSTPALDSWVEALSDAPYVYGARLTGGGFGGAVMAFTAPEFSQDLAEDANQLYRKARPDSPDSSIIHVQTGDGSQII